MSQVERSQGITQAITDAGRIVFLRRDHGASGAPTATVRSCWRTG